MPFEPQVDDAELRVREVIPALRRSKWLVLACAAVSFSAAALYARKIEPVYQAAVSIWIEGKQKGDVPDVFRAFAQNPDVATDIAALGSRTLIEEATRILGLQVRLISPRGVARDLLVQNIHATPGAAYAEYRLERQSNGSFEVHADGTRVTSTRPGEQFSLPGVSLQLTPAAAEYPELHLRVQPFSDAVAQTGPLTVERAGKEANIIKLRYEDTDRGLVWKVPNVIAERFIARRQDAQKVATRSQAKFLREQIDTISAQLSGAESELKTFRERAQVVNPAVESNSQINRLINLQGERGSLEAERAALAGLLEEVEARHKQQAAGEPSVYRELLAFPSLLRNQAASQLLSSLAQVEDQRATLLARRTEADPDVRLLSNRIVELENQLSTMAGAYLKGLSNQVSSLDAAIDQFGTELGRMPRKEMEFARLERKPVVLKEIYTLLQTRLKEAEIAEAAVNSSITIEDPAIEPRYPVNAKAWLLMLLGLVGGGLLGIGLTLIREYADKSIKTRSDATAASGLPVMAIVPRLPRQSHRSSIIARRSTAATPNAAVRAPNRQSPTGTGYTFLSWTTSQENSPGVPNPRTEGTEIIARHPPARMSLSRSAGALTEAYAILQTNITFSRPGEDIKVLALTSALPGEGKTTTSVNLALTMCQRGLSVCLIDADLRRPQLHEVFHLTREPGLSEVLRGLQTFEGACRPVQIGESHQLAVLTAGSCRGGNVPGLVGSTRMRTLLSELREQFDLVILDTPPVNILTDAALLGVNADGVLLVVRAGSTDSAALQYAMEQLNHVRAPALGIVLNAVDLKRFGPYDSAYKYYSNAAYSEASPKSG